MKTFKIKLNETVTGLTNTTWDPTGVVSGRAATEDQLKAATSTMASWYTLANLRDEYVVNNVDFDVFLANLGRPATYSGWGIVQNVPLQVTAEDSTWYGPDADGYGYTTTNVIVTFPDGSSLVKENVTFKKNFEVEDRVYAVRLGEGATFVDTGLTLNFAYRFDVKGYIEEGIQGSLMGAYTSNSVRTTIRVLGGSNKAQLCWPNIVEVPAANMPCDGDSTFSYRRMCRIVVSGRAIGYNYKWHITGTGDVGQECSGSGANANWQATGTDSAKIYLLNEQANSSYRNAILREARIYDENDVLIRMFQGAKRNGEVVIVDAISGDIYRPDAGTLVEVTE